MIHIALILITIIHTKHIIIHILLYMTVTILHIALNHATNTQYIHYVLYTCIYIYTYIYIYIYIYI